MSDVFSSRDQLKKIQRVLERYARLPFMTETIPGSIMEGVLAYVRDARRLNTYDFVDVVDERSRLGWQVKSTKASTPVTWKRAKIPNSIAQIALSRKSTKGLQSLGDAIIKFCNLHAHQSLELYNLKAIGYSRLLVREGGEVTYFERLLCTRENPDVFDATEFEWRWSEAKKTKKKEQLSSLHGIHRPTGKKWWAWHGLGENQLHFSGESNWWPDAKDPHTIDFRLPSEKDKLSLEAFLEMLEEAKLPT